ncbi:MAG: isopentenyl phosphate kinase [Thermoplasmatota archaeon]
MSRPALVKLGGSLLTDKSKERAFRRTAARRLLAEVVKSGVPTVVLHGAGSFGHPAAARHEIGKKAPGPHPAGAVAASDVMAGVALLSAQVVDLAHIVGLRPLHVPLHFHCHMEGDDLIGVPVERIRRLLEEGFTPVLSGTLVRDDEVAWRVVSADQLMEVLAPELAPRLAVMATDVEGVFDRHPDDEGAALLPEVDVAALDDLEQAAGVGNGAGGAGGGADVTGRMLGKVRRALTVAESCPTVILDGSVRGRLLDALKGKSVPGTRVVA